MSKLKPILLYATVVMVTLVVGSPAYALSCGDTVSGHVVLTADLNCSGPGLVVLSDGTKIDLNGHKISCTNGFADAYQGSCQKSHTTQAQSIIGIASTGHNDVQVRGPGVIDGFGVGIRLVNGTGLQVRDVTLTGPASPNASLNDRVGAVGVLIANTVCPDSAVIQDNDISNHTMGIQLSSAFCVVVKDNAIHDNNGVFGDSHGIDLIASGNNTIMKNVVTENGVNRGAPSGGIDGGIMLRTGSANNQVKQNTVSNNCGDGITTNNLAHDNVVQQNTARFNSTSTLSGQCDGVVLGTYFDLAQRSVNASTWDPNNVCRTQNAAVPAGVCGPAE
jgi:parallel beta-helix repeat protein